jgi:hypothetical protein
MLTTEAEARLDERLLLGDPSRELGADGTGLASGAAPRADTAAGSAGAADAAAVSAAFAASRSARRCVLWQAGWWRKSENHATRI